MKTIYLSGQISNLPEEQVKGNFTYAALEVMFMQPDEVDVISPLNIKPLFGIHSYWCHMAADIYHELKCTHVAFQKNWIDSRGARIEMIVALITNKKIIML